MKSKTNQEIKWSLLELSGLLEEEDSRIYFERTKKHVALHPFYLTNLQAALNEVLSSMLNTYDTELKGFTLAYKNPKLLTNLGETFCDTCFIHVDIEADFYLFRPEVGCSLKGIVNKKGLDHIVVLIHKTFTISIPKPDDTEEWPGDLVDIGQEVRCCVTQIDRRIKLPFICATLNSDYMQGCRLPERINNIDNMDTTIGSNNLNSTSEIDGSSIAVSEGDISDRDRKKSRKKHMKKSRKIDSEYMYKNKAKAEPINNSGDDVPLDIKCESKQQRKSMKYDTSSIDHSLSDTMIDGTSKKHKKSKSKVSSDSGSETVKIKIEKPDSIVDNMEPAQQSLFNNDDTYAHNDMNLNGYMESRKAIKRENSITDTNEPEKKKRKKHSKKSRESDLESVCTTENEEKINNKKVKAITNNTSFTRDDKEKHYKNRKHRVSNTDLSSSNSDVDSVPKKHKRSKSRSTIMSDSKPEDNIKIKIEEPDSATDETIAERLGNQIYDESATTHNLEYGNIEMRKHIKREESVKEKKKSRNRMSRGSDSKPILKIKSEDEINNEASISRKIKYDEDEEQAAHTKLNTSDIDTSLSDIIFKKPKKSKKARKMSDSESEHHVEIKIERN